LKKPDFDILLWQDAVQIQNTIWRAENGAAAPKRVLLADDTLNADSAYRLACEGCGLLWQGDFQNARQLLQAMARRCDQPARKSKKDDKANPEPAELFHLHRQAQSQRARILGMVLVTLNADYRIPLKRAPDVSQACNEAYGPSPGVSMIVSLREVQSLIGAHEWRKKGVLIPALDAHIHPHYGVFSPVRGEYIDLVVSTPLPDTETAFDIGTGTGVLAAVLAKRGVKRVIATDMEPRALRCAQENIDRLGLTETVTILQTDLFPDSKSGLIVCNPPWVPARPGSPIEAAIFDSESKMLHGFIAGLAAHLEPKGEGWLLLSDLAEHLGLRSREQLLLWIKNAGLRVVERIDIKPRHPKAADATDLLYAARAAEITSLWRLQIN
jgi:methylase of polypeptide subunit release factors